MSVFPEKYFDKFYWGICAIVFVIVVLRCMLVPFSHDEVATFNFYIQPGQFLPFLSHPDANGHFLMSATSWVCFKLVGSSPLALRLPCIMGFAVLCYGVFKMNKLFSSLSAKVVFSSAFILSYHFISFYSLCRGYGLSMSFMVLSLYYFFVYKRYGAFSHFLKFLLFSQLALSANLTLVFVVLITTALLMLVQFRTKALFTIKNLLALLLHFGLIFFWIKYAFFLKENGALYYGSGESYWAVTFETLIETVLLKNTIIEAVVLAIFFTMLSYLIYRVYKEGFRFMFENSFSIAFFVFCSLVVTFWLLKKLVGVNYPEDRTGLFFYIFFITAFSFMINEARSKIKTIALVIPLCFIIQFVSAANLRVHPWRVYETMPHSFFALLREEQEKSSQRITIGGHRVREFFYGFLNYKSSVKLNHVTSPEALQMNCDYAVAYIQDKPWYDAYYTELAVDNDWGFRLLKRKTPVARKLLLSYDQISLFTGAGEYFNAFEKLDTTFNSENPLLAEFNFNVEKAPEPLNAWLVLQVDDGTGQDNNQFLRIPLNLVKFDWNGTKSFTLSIVSGNIPLKIKRIVAYLWNIDKKEINMKMNSFRLYQLEGEGVKVISKAKI